MFASACGDDAADARVSANLGEAPREPRVTDLVERPLLSASEVASMLAELQDVTGHIARVARARAQHAEVAALATETLADLLHARESLVQNCSPVRAESVWMERARRSEQDWVTSLREASDEDFDALFLSALASLRAEFLEMLEERVRPEAASPEQRELKQLRRLMVRHAEEADRLLGEFGVVN